MVVTVSRISGLDPGPPSGGRTFSREISGLALLTREGGAYPPPPAGEVPEGRRGPSERDKCWAETALVLVELIGEKVSPKRGAAVLGRFHDDNSGGNHQNKDGCGGLACPID